MVMTLRIRMCGSSRQNVRRPPLHFTMVQQRSAGGDTVCV